MCRGLPAAADQLWAAQFEKCASGDHAALAPEVK